MTATITSAWSTYGHRFIETDTPEHESCLTCGALFQLTPDPDTPTRGEYTAADGSAPMACTGDTGMAHGYPGERYCHEHDTDPRGLDHGCEHTTHECNCLLCNS